MLGSEPGWTRARRGWEISSLRRGAIRENPVSRCGCRDKWRTLTWCQALRNTMVGVGTEHPSWDTQCTDEAHIDALLRVKWASESRTYSFLPFYTRGDTANTALCVKCRLSNVPTFAKVASRTCVKNMCSCTGGAFDITKPVLDWQMQVVHVTTVSISKATRMILTLQVVVGVYVQTIRERCY